MSADIDIMVPMPAPTCSANWFKPAWRILSIIITYNRVFLSRIRDKNKSGAHPFTRHTLEFELPVSASTVADLRNPDKSKLKETILALRAQGWSYRQIGHEVELHWTRVGQIVKRAMQ
jgi:hypothetical protein